MKYVMLFIVINLSTLVGLLLLDVPYDINPLRAFFGASMFWLAGAFVYKNIK